MDLLAVALHIFPFSMYKILFNLEVQNLLFHTSMGFLAYIGEMDISSKISNFSSIVTYSPTSYDFWKFSTNFFKNSRVGASLSNSFLLWHLNKKLKRDDEIVVPNISIPVA